MAAIKLAIKLADPTNSLNPRDAAELFQDFHL
jgi:hypothetical protein